MSNEDSGSRGYYGFCEERDTHFNLTCKLDSDVREAVTARCDLQPYIAMISIDRH